MAKRNNRVRSSVVGDPEEIDRIMSEEFNPVKTEVEDNRSAEFVSKYTRKLLEEFAEFYSMSNETIDKSVDSFLEQFNPVKIEVEQPKVKTTAAFDNSRLEFLRIQIGPVQSFYQTLGNILFSLSMRLDVAEAKVESLKVQLDTAVLERTLFHKYLQECSKNELIASVDGFVKFIREYAEEKESETKTDKE